MNTQSDAEKSGKLGSVAWAAFFIWVGIAMLANFPWGWFLLGVGILILAAQCARWFIGLKIEGFWIACATVFIAAGLWTLLNLPWQLAPILIILLGMVLLGKAVIGFSR